MAIILLNCCPCPSREQSPDHFWVRFGLHFGLIFGSPSGAIFDQNTRKQRFLELSCPPKRLGFGSLFGFNFGYISGSISGRLPRGRFSEEQPEENIIIFSIGLAQQPRAQKEIIRPYYLIQNYFFDYSSLAQKKIRYYFVTHCTSLGTSAVRVVQGTLAQPRGYLCGALGRRTR